MSPGATSDRVYAEIRRRLAEGELRPGARIEPAALGEELFASVTPVRDALHRLAGERLVEMPRHNGFRVPAPTEAALRDLYRWRGQLVALALRNRPPPDTAGASPPQEAAQLFAAVAAWPGSAEHVAAVAALNDRIAPFGRAERHVLDGLDAEFQTLVHVLNAAEPRALARATALYHARRIRAVPRIVAARTEGL